MRSLGAWARTWVHFTPLNPFTIAEHFQYRDHLLHRRPLAGLSHTLHRQKHHHVGSSLRVLALQFRVHNLVEPTGVGDIALGPVQEATVGPGLWLIYCSAAWDQFQQHNPEAEYIALGCQMPWRKSVHNKDVKNIKQIQQVHKRSIIISMALVFDLINELTPVNYWEGFHKSSPIIHTCLDIFRSSIAFSAHDLCRYMRLISSRAFPCQPKVGELGIEVLPFNKLS